jgi:TusA-related sulfurtransferase
VSITRSGNLRHMLTPNMQPTATIDLRQTKCPLNFVKAKLALEKLAQGQVLEIWIDATGESAINIPNSFTQEGQQVVHTDTSYADRQILWVLRQR